MKGTKQSLNLTGYAWYILRCDYSAFTSENTASKNISANFLCDLFMKYFPEAQASIGIRIKEREAKIRKMFGTHENTELQMIFSEAEATQICEATLSRFSEITKNDSEIHTIYVPDSVSTAISELAMGSEAYYYHSYKNADGHYMRYFRAVLEEYARLPYCRRESIYFKDTIDKLNAAVSGGFSVMFYYGSEQICGYPYAVEYDEWSSYNYLLLADAQRNICHFRISRIKSLSCLRADTMELSYVERTEIRAKQIIPVGIQFAGEPTMEVKVMLTENGMRMYNRMVFLRPQYVSVRRSDNGEYLCTFSCSENQIKYYFFKFGSEAEIVSPSALREYFRDGYLMAYSKYKSK